MNEVTFNNKELEAVAEQILAEAKRAGADQAEVAVSANKGFSISARDGDVETVEYNQDKSVEVSVYFGKRSGSASMTDIRPEAIRDAVEAACHIAKFTDEDPAGGLADKEDMAFHYPHLDLSFPWDITVEKAIELACECEREALAYDKRIMSAEDVAVGTVSAIHIYANSHGFMGVCPYTRHDMSCVLIAKDKDGMQRDYSYTTSADPSMLQSVLHLARDAAECTVQRLGARQLRTIKAPVLFVAKEARGFIGHFASAISGGSIYRKTSFLVDQLGKKIFPDFVHIHEQPHLARALGSSPFDGEGVATRPNVFIEGGVLKSYSLGSYAARKLGMMTTGNAGGIHNLTIDTGDKDFKALLKAMDTGLLVTEMMGNGVNMITGDYSRGVGGFWVEKGEIQYPVQEVTIAGKLQDMFAHLVEVGNDVDVRGNIRTGSILLDEMMIAGS